jgi:GT2 family glycosyltransferase
MMQKPVLAIDFHRQTRFIGNPRTWSPCMAAQRVTIAVVPRERFSFAIQSLQSVLAQRDPATELVYIDGGSPPLVRQFLEQRAARHSFQLVSTERYISPNAARNLAAAHTRTKYLALVDNDVLVSPGWVEALLACAEATGAAIVAPVCCTGSGEAATVLDAGGTVELAFAGNRRVLRVENHHRGRRLAGAATPLRREAVKHVAFHAALFRTSALAEVGAFDEKLLSVAQEADLCLRVAAAGGTIMVEPAAVVAHAPPPPFDAEDLEYFQLRWSDVWNRASIEHFRAKWNLTAHDEALAEMARELDAHRRLLLEPYRRMLRLLGTGPARWFEDILIAPWEQAANRRRFPAARVASGELRRVA